MPTNSNRSFGALFGVIFTILGIRAPNQVAQTIYLLLALCFIGSAWLRPNLLAPLNHAWAIFGRALQKISNPVLLGIVYFGIITPLGLVAKALKRNPLTRTWDKNTNSYWIPKVPSQSMRRQF